MKRNLYHTSHSLGWLLPNKKTNKQKQEIASVDKSVDNLEPLCTVGRNRSGATVVENGIVVAPQIELSYNPSIPLLGIYPTELRVGVSKKYMSTHVHSIIMHNSQRWKQPKCSSTGEWKRKMCLSIMEYYSALERMKILTYATRQMNPEIIILVK